MADRGSISKKRKLVQLGLLKSELNEFLTRTLAEDGYAGCTLDPTPLKLLVVIRATRTREISGEKGQRIKELASLIQKRFGYKPGQVDLLVERIDKRGLCAMAQAESLRYKMLKGLPARRACYGVLRSVMEAGAKGCEVVVAGKLRAQRAKTMKFKDGYMIFTGHPATAYIEEAIRSVQMKQGVLGLRVKIMLPYDPNGLAGCSMPIPDNVVVRDPK